MPVLGASVKKFFRPVQLDRLIQTKIGWHGLGVLAMAVSVTDSHGQPEDGQSVAPRNPAVVRKRPNFSGRILYSPGMHPTCMQTCAKHALIVHSLVRSEDSTHPTGQASRADLRHSRACGNPVVVRKRPQFRAGGCTIAPGVPLNCIQTCTKHALIVRSWCVPKTPRHPTGQASEVESASFPRMGESSGCRKAAPIQRRRMHERPRNALEVHSNLHETCTDCALVVRSEDSTAPYKIDNQRWNCVIPALAGMTRLTESVLNSA